MLEEPSVRATYVFYFETSRIEIFINHIVYVKGTNVYESYMNSDSIEMGRRYQNIVYSGECILIQRLYYVIHKCDIIISLKVIKC